MEALDFSVSVKNLFLLESADLVFIAIANVIN